MRVSFYFQPIPMLCMLLLSSWRMNMASCFAPLPQRSGRPGMLFLNREEGIACPGEQTVIIWEGQSNHDRSVDWKRLDVAPRVAKETWNWCEKFVLPLQLCPWARSSLETPLAIQMFLADSLRDGVVEDVGVRFEEFLRRRPDIESAAIFFIIFQPNEFGEFYDWFVDLEETWDLLDTVIVAPFHPDWNFLGEVENLQFEKRSPYPTVTLVSTTVVENAGEDATAKIGMNNEETLLKQPIDKLRDMWERIQQLE